MEPCEVCGNGCERGVAEWHYECRVCGTEHSTFEPRINSPEATVSLDEDERARGLAPVRRETYRRVLAELAVTAHEHRAVRSAVERCRNLPERHRPDAICGDGIHGAPTFSQP